MSNYPNTSSPDQNTKIEDSITPPPIITIILGLLVLAFTIFGINTDYVFLFAIAFVVFLIYLTVRPVDSNSHQK